MIPVGIKIKITTLTKGEYIHFPCNKLYLTENTLYLSTLWGPVEIA